MTGSADDFADRELVVTRTFAASRARVYAAWTSPDAIGRWWGPNGFTTTTYAMDVRPQGVWRSVMHGPDGTDYENHIAYREVVFNERLAYTHGATADDPDAFAVTVTFTDRPEGTLVTLHSVWKSAAQRRQVVEEFGALDGAHQTLARLAEVLAAAG